MRKYTLQELIPYEPLHAVVQLTKEQHDILKPLCPAMNKFVQNCDSYMFAGGYGIKENYSHPTYTFISFDQIALPNALNDNNYPIF